MTLKLNYSSDIFQLKKIFKVNKNKPGYVKSRLIKSKLRRILKVFSPPDPNLSGSQQNEETAQLRSDKPDPRAGTEPRLELELFFRLTVMKDKARARSSLISESSIELFCLKNGEIS